MDDWREQSLGELIEIKHGFAFRGEHFCDYPTSDVLVTPGNFAIGGGFKSDKCKYYDGPVPEEFVLRSGDLVVTMTDLSKQADSLGYSARVPTARHRFLHNQRVGRVTAKSGKVDLDFIGWLMRTPSYRAAIVGSATGSTVKHTSPKRIQEYRFLLPPLPLQQAISSLLSSLDEKIELNRRMNETLEAIARAIFRDWFVDFGPTRAKMDGQEPHLAAQLCSLFPDALNETGVPRGWRLGRLRDIAESPSRTVLPRKVDPATPYIALEHMPRKSIALGDWAQAEKATTTKSRFNAGEFLFGKLRPYFHKVGIAPVDGICSTDIVVVVPKQPHWSAMVIGCISSDDFVEHSNLSSTGTKMPRTSWPIMRDYQLAIPSLVVAEAFDDLCLPMIERIIANVQESRTLAELRDLLLPKLMSGEISVAAKGQEPVE